jgi:NAD(P)-dependent dehydrogenase (short-subunit alcohol dehydrogenase family)
MVQRGSGYAHPRPGEYTVAPGDTGDHVSLLAQLASDGVAPRNVAHLWTIDESPQAAQPGEPARHFSGLSAFAQAAGEISLGPCRLSVVSTGIYAVTGDETLDPAKAAVTGPCTVIPLEYRNLSCRLVDLGPVHSPADVTAAAAMLYSELRLATAPATVCVRGSRRWVREYTRCMAPPEPAAGTAIRAGGVYVITGGLGGLGLAIADGMASQGARLVLISRAGLPDQETWASIQADESAPEDLLRRIRSVLDLRAAGADVLVLAADITRREDVEKALTETRETFGRIDGVVHAAGVPGKGLLQFKTEAEVASVLAPKTEGTRILRECLAGTQMDFLVLFSSVAALTGGGPGQADYCAANAYLGAVSHAAPATAPYRTITIDWGEWQWNAWDLALTGFDPAITKVLRDIRERIGIRADEGWQALARCLAWGQPHVIVSSQDVPVLVEVTAAIGSETVANLRQASGERHARPELSTDYAAADTEPALTIAEIWANALALQQVGLYDDFFELGGNSLIGVELIAKIRGTLGCSRLPPHVLYEAPTVAALAERIGAMAVHAEEQLPADGERRLRGSWRRQALHERGRA